MNLKQNIQSKKQLREMTLDDMKAGVSKVRNRVIVRVLGALGLVEEWGSGYKRVIEACRTGGYPEPEW